MSERKEIWPLLEWDEWRPTAETLHMFLQIVGKTRLALTPVQNHWWNVPLYVTARGLSTSVLHLPEGDALDLEFDFIDHRLVYRNSTGESQALPLGGQTVAAFYRSHLEVLGNLDVRIDLDPMPVELKEPIRFDLDTVHGTYDGSAAWRFWRALSRADRLFKLFATGFYGKISPVHFFWGSMDLAVTRFNGLRAPPRPGADPVQGEAYSHECISAGFWPGNGGYGKAAFYSYAAPMPPELVRARLSGPGRFDTGLGEFLLDYDDVRQSADPDATVLAFLDAAYATASGSCGWDRARLDRPERPLVRRQRR